jgi:hypothetical protein
MQGFGVQRFSVCSLDNDWALPLLILKLLEGFFPQVQLQAFKESQGAIRQQRSNGLPAIIRRGASALRVSRTKVRYLHHREPNGESVLDCFFKGWTYLDVCEAF